MVPDVSADTVSREFHLTSFFLFLTLDSLPSFIFFFFFL